MYIKIKKVRDGFTLMKKSTETAVAYDLVLPDETFIHHGREIVPLGFKMEIEPGYEAKIEPRSGFSSKGILDLGGIRRDADVLVGKIDPDYRGEVGVMIKSNETAEFVLPAGTRIAQLTIYKVETPDFEFVDELSETVRGEGGFGSTGTIYSK